MWFGRSIGTGVGDNVVGWKYWDGGGDMVFGGSMLTEVGDIAFGGSIGTGVGTNVAGSKYWT